MRARYVRRVWRLLAPKGAIPGVDERQRTLVQPSASRRFERHLRRYKSGARANASLAARMEPHGLRVYDRDAGLSELDGYLTRGQGG